jgi:hypothetical protein
LVAASTATGVKASTDCERWIATYKAELAHARAVKRLQAAHARVKHAAQRRLANYVKKPAAPKPVLAHYVKPRLTPEQLLCGDLPEGAKPPRGLDKLLDGKMPPMELASDGPPFLPLIPEDTDEGLIPEAGVPPYVPPGMSTGSSGPFGGGGFAPPMGGDGGYNGGGNGGQVVSTSSGTEGGGTPPPPPVLTAVLEPDSLTLLLTGVAAAAGAMRRRSRR